MSNSAVTTSEGQIERIGLAAPTYRLPPIVRAMRPLQWTKNGLVFAALIFADRALDLESVLRALGAALVFCAVSSAIYLINDVRDVEQDRLHPTKRNRPIASGEVTPRSAIMISAALLICGFVCAFAVRPAFVAIVATYVALMIAYSYGLKRIVILDVFAISAGFVLRAVGGAVAISVPISPWLYVCTMLGALFLGFAKRRNEIATLDTMAGRHRANLEEYTVPMLDQIIAIVSAATLMAYSLYTFDAQNVPSNHSMMLTIPFVLYALFRYLFLVYKKELGGSPEVVLVTDKPLLACILGWVATSVAILYVF